MTPKLYLQVQVDPFQAEINKALKALRLCYEQRARDARAGKPPQYCVAFRWDDL